MAFICFVPCSSPDLWTILVPGTDWGQSILGAGKNAAWYLWSIQATLASNTNTGSENFWSLSFGNKIWEQFFLPFIYEYLLCMDKVHGLWICHEYQSHSRKWSRHGAQSQNLGGWDWKAEFKASLGRCSSYFSYCCDQIPVKNNLQEMGFCGLRVLGDKTLHGRKRIMSRNWGTARKQRDHRLDRISNI